MTRIDSIPQNKCKQFTVESNHSPFQDSLQEKMKFLQNERRSPSCQTVFSMRGAFSHSIEIAKEWNKLKELKKGIKKYPIEQWQASHSKDVESGTNY
jgi:hypothetical protein